MLNHDVTFNRGSAKVGSPAIFQTYFSDHKDLWITATDCYVYHPLNCAISTANNTSVNKFS